MKVAMGLFSGLQPRKAPHLLGDTHAQVATNCDLETGELGPLDGLWVQSIIQDVVGVEKIYRFGAKWLFFTEDTDLVPGPIADDTKSQTYLTSASGVPKMFNSDMVTTDALGRAQVSPRPLGVPKPAVTPSLSASGGSGTDVARAAVFTYVTDLGEESRPSGPSSVIDGKLDDTWVIAGMGTAAPTGYAHITKKRIYLAASGVTTTQYHLWAEVDVDQDGYSGTFTTAGADTLPSTTWDTPPSGLRGLVALPGGILAGFTGKTVCFCDPYHLYAWPVDYQHTLNHEIIGLGVIGTTLVVCTDAYPHLIACPDPTISTPDKLDTLAPCVSKRGIVSTEYGVLYPSPDGIVVVNASGASIITRDLFTRRHGWNVYAPEEIMAVFHSGKYYAFMGSRGFVFDPNEATSRLREIAFSCSAAFISDEGFKLYVAYSVSGSTYISEWEGNNDAPWPYEWKSKKFFAPDDINFAAIRVTADFPEYMTEEKWQELRDSYLEEYEDELMQGPPYGGEFGGGGFGEFPFAGDLMDSISAAYIPPAGVTLFIYMDGEHWHTVPAIGDDSPNPLPMGTSGREWEILVTGTPRIQSIEMATSVDELMEY